MTESLAMYPAASVLGGILLIPGKVFGLGKIKHDQGENIAKERDRSSCNGEMVVPNLDD